MTAVKIDNGVFVCILNNSTLISIALLNLLFKAALTHLNTQCQNKICCKNCDSESFLIILAGQQCYIANGGEN